MSTKVIYWEMFAGKETEEVHDVCFARLKLSDSIRYKCPIRCTIPEAMVWVEFLPTILNKELYSFEVDEKDGPSIMWRLDCREMLNRDRLLHLTAMRYPDEFPELMALYA